MRATILRVAAIALALSLSPARIIRIARSAVLNIASARGQRERRGGECR